MAHNITLVTPNRAPAAHNRIPVAHNRAPAAHNITPAPPPPSFLLYTTPYIYTLLLPTAVRRGSKVGIPRGRSENHENIQSLLLWFWNLPFSFPCVLR